MYPAAEQTARGLLHGASGTCKTWKGRPRPARAARAACTQATCNDRRTTNEVYDFSLYVPRAHCTTLEAPRDQQRAVGSRESNKHWQAAIRHAQATATTTSARQTTRQQEQREQATCGTAATTDGTGTRQQPRTPAEPLGTRGNISTGLSASTPACACSADKHAGRLVSSHRRRQLQHERTERLHIRRMLRSRVHAVGVGPEQSWADHPLGLR